MNIIKMDLIHINNNSQNQLYIRIVNVNGVKLQYNAFVLSDGTINIDRINEIK